MISREAKAIYDREYYRRNKVARDAASSLYSELHPENKRKYSRHHKLQLKIDAFNHYGFSCSCCGESDVEFLSIDHVEGGGCKHRKQIGVSIYAWLRKNNYPDGFRTLCFNCNMARGFYGYCPHELSGGSV